MTPSSALVFGPKLTGAPPRGARRPTLDLNNLRAWADSASWRLLGLAARVSISGSGPATVGPGLGARRPQHATGVQHGSTG